MKYITAFDPTIERRVPHTVKDGWATSTVSGNRFRYTKVRKHKRKVIGKPKRWKKIEDSYFATTFDKKNSDKRITIKPVSIYSNIHRVFYGRKNGVVYRSEDFDSRYKALKWAIRFMREHP